MCVLLALQLDLERGTVASHSTMVVRSTIRPNRQAEYLWTITYTTLNTSGRTHTHSIRLNVYCNLTPSHY